MTPRHNLLRVGFDLISYDDAIQAIVAWRSQGKRHYVCLSNPHSVMMCRRDRQMHWATNRATLVLPDGSGIILAARLLGYAHCGRVTGPSLMLRLCDAGRRHGLRCTLAIRQTWSGNDAC